MMGMSMTTPEVLLLVVGAWAAFAVSASAGLGGSLLLVPTIVFVTGPKEGVALAALLLAFNNIAKLVAYRRTLPFRRAVVVVIPTILGAYVGASLLARAPELWVTIAVIGMLAASLVVETSTGTAERRVGTPLMATASGVASGFSGTSGPLKGVAVRGLGLDRYHTVGAATLASLSGDVTKSLTYAGDGLLGADEMLLGAALLPLMITGTLFGVTFNRRIGEAGYAAWFWLVTGGYALRLAGLLP